MNIKDVFNKIRYSIQIKLTLPYVLLSMIAALGGGLIITQFIVQSIDERLNGSLIETAIISKEIIVDQEDLMLESLRLITYLSGIDQMVNDEDPEGLRGMILPVVFNSSEDAVEILNTAGISIISIRRDLNANQQNYLYTKWSDQFVNEDSVQWVLAGEVDQQGDKYAAIIEVNGEDYLYVVGPIKDAENNLLGVIMVGKLVSELLTEIRRETAAQITTYEINGQVIASTFPDPVGLGKDISMEMVANQDQESIIRDFPIVDLSYREVISVWKLRGDLEVGLLGVSFSTSFLHETQQKTKLNVFGLVSTVLFVIIIVGIYIARMITSPIQTLKSAAIAVSEGDLEVQVDPIGNDEIALLTRSFNDMVSNIKESKAELIDAYDRTLEGWVKALELRDEETEGHTQRVTTMTVELASLCGINGTELEHVRRGALLHDIGKVGVPDDILNKPGKLTDEEFEVIKQHPWYAYEMLSLISFLVPAMDIPYSHHEKWDGSGYPDGIKGRGIPLPARIFSLVDVWDAITSDRPYRKAMPFKKAIKIIEEGRGSHFDPELTDIFLEYIKKVE
jgi:HD-GYP domain-containing protein (c-di-GMP phosphodiesterase class II)